MCVAVRSATPKGRFDGWRRPSGGLGMTPALPRLAVTGPVLAPTPLLHHMPDATPQLRVLVIDDSADNAEALCILLSILGCVTAVASSGRPAS